MITLPAAFDGETMFVALVAMETSFRYLSLGGSQETDGAATGVRRLSEWTADGPAADAGLSVQPSPSEFVSAVRRYVS